MIRNIGVMAAIVLVGACSDPQPDDYVAAFESLEDGELEIRMGAMPELSASQCNRQIYAGYRDDYAELLLIQFSLVASRHGISRQAFERELTLERTSQNTLVAGQTPLFPLSIDSPCSDIHVTMLTMTCAYGSQSEVRDCPMAVRWQWLQGFEMFTIPNRR